MLEVLDRSTIRRPNETPSCKTHGAVALNVAFPADFRFSVFFAKILIQPTVSKASRRMWARLKAYDIGQERML